MTTQFITIAAHHAVYGLPIGIVQEIKAWTGVCPLPGSVPALCGVMNLRGAIVPVYDLSMVQDGVATTVTPAHVVVILTLQDRTVGLLADAVQDILTVEPSQIQLPPGGSSLVTGLVQDTARMVMILDPARLLADPVQEAA